jgi:hypothetical protein
MNYPRTRVASSDNCSTFKENEVDISEIDKILRVYSIAQIINNSIQTEGSNIGSYQNRQSDISSVKYENDSFENRYYRSYLSTNSANQGYIVANNLVDNRNERQNIQQVDSKSFINAVVYSYPQAISDNRTERINTDLQQAISDKRLQYILISFINSLADSIASQNLTSSIPDETYNRYNGNIIKTPIVDLGRVVESEKYGYSPLHINNDRPEKAEQKNAAKNYSVNFVGNSVLDSLDGLNVKVNNLNSSRNVNKSEVVLHESRNLTEASTTKNSIDSRQRELANAGVEILKRDSEKYQGNFPEHYYEKISRELFEKALEKTGGDYSKALDLLNNLSGNSDTHIETFVGGMDYDSFYQKEYTKTVGSDSENGWDKVRHFTGTANSQYDSSGFFAPEAFTYGKEAWDALENLVGKDPEGYSIPDIRADNRGEAFGEELQKRENGTLQKIKDFVKDLFSDNKQANSESPAQQPKSTPTPQPEPTPIPQPKPTPGNSKNGTSGSGNGGSNGDGGADKKGGGSKSDESNWDYVGKNPSDNIA